MNLSKNVTLNEAVRSQTATRLGINNMPDEDQLENMKYICENVFEPCRDWASRKRKKDTPIFISSFLRVPDLNKAIGGSTTSQHCSGEAMDLDLDIWYKPKDISNADLFHYIRENLLFDQLIWEFGDDDNPAWVHVSRKKEGNRRMILKCYKDKNNKTHYDNWKV